MRSEGDRDRELRKASRSLKRMLKELEPFMPPRPAANPDAPKDWGVRPEPRPANEAERMKHAADPS